MIRQISNNFPDKIINIEDKGKLQTASTWPTVRKAFFAHTQFYCAKRDPNLHLAVLTVCF